MQILKELIQARELKINNGTAIKQMYSLARSKTAQKGQTSWRMKEISKVEASYRLTMTMNLQSLPKSSNGRIEMQVIFVKF